MGNALDACSSSRYEDLQKQIEAQERTIEELRQKNASELGEKDSVIEKLTAEMRALQEEMERTKAEKVGTDAEVTAQKTRIGDLTSRVETLQATLTKAQAEKAAYDQRKNEIAERDRKIHELHDQIASMQKQIASVSADKEEHSSKENDRKRDAEVSDLTKKLGDMQTAMQSLEAQQEEAQRLRREYEEQRRKVAALEPRVAELSSTLELKERELAKMKAAAENRQSELQRLSDLISQLQLQISSTSTEAVEAKTKLAERVSQLEELQIELEAKRHIEHELALLNNKVSEQERMLTFERRRSVQLEQKLEADRLARGKKQFGVALKDCDVVAVPQYGSIPAVLETLKAYLLSHGGLETVGIFRLAPNQPSIEKAKKELNVGLFESTDDISTAANLIGLFYRDLPTPILATLKEKDVLKCKDATACWKLVKTLPEAEYAVFAWLMDLGAEIAAKAEVNKMSPKNLAIVFAPNLFKMAEVKPNSNPMEIMNQIKQYAVFIELCIQGASDR